MNISVAVLTKNRAQYLLECLNSLQKQLEKDDELIVIDNNSTDQTKELIEQYSKDVVFKVNYILEKRSGLPILRNRALKVARNKYLAFIDDDCLADLDWVKEIKKELSLIRDSKLAVLIGRSKTLYPSNTFALLSEFKTSFWKLSAQKGKEVLDYEILDSKNIVYNRKFLKEKNIQFDESRSKKFNGASEDADIGMQIFKAGGKAVYLETMLVYHRDPQHCFAFYKKLISSTLAHSTFEKKWQSLRKKMPKNKKINKKEFVNDFFAYRDLIFCKKVAFFTHLILMLVLVKWVKFYGKIFQ